MQEQRQRFHSVQSGLLARFKPGLVGRVRHLKGEQSLRHATLQEIEEES